MRAPLPRRTEWVLAISCRNLLSRIGSERWLVAVETVAENEIVVHGAVVESVQLRAIGDVDRAVDEDRTLPVQVSDRLARCPQDVTGDRIGADEAITAVAGGGVVKDAV